MANDESARRLTRPEPAWHSPPSESHSYVGERLIGHYRVEELIGDGGTARVYRGRDEAAPHRHVALKVLRHEFAGDEGVRSRFLREAQAATAIDNPYVVSIVDSGIQSDGTAWYAMELLDGATIAELLDEHGCLPLPYVRKLALQIVDGLTAAHEKGIIHRDLKPENVAVTSEAVVKILDFGIAKHTKLLSQTLPGEVFGTPEYMSPEHAIGEQVDARSDIYALGTMLYEMVCGSRPFSAPTHVRLVMSLLRDEPAPLSERAQVPEAFEALIMRCLKRRPDERFASMRELGEALRSISV